MVSVRFFTIAWDEGCHASKSEAVGEFVVAEVCLVIRLNNHNKSNTAKIPLKFNRISTPPGPALIKTTTGESKLQPNA